MPKFCVFNLKYYTANYGLIKQLDTSIFTITSMNYDIFFIISRFTYSNVVSYRFVNIKK